MKGTVQRRRGQGMDVTAEQVAIERARARMSAAAGRDVSFLILWSPEETEALRATLAGQGVTA